MKRFSMAVLLGMAFCGAAQASLLEGKTLGFQIHYPTIDSVTAESLNGDYLVGPGTEILVPGFVKGDFSDTNLMADFDIGFTYGSGPFYGWEFIDVNGDIDAFTSVSLNPLTNLSGLDMSRISFNSDHVWVNLQGLTVNPNTVVSIDLNAAAVPEPGTCSLILAGALGVLGMGRGRRLRASAA